MKGKIPKGSLVEQFMPVDYSDVYIYDVVAKELSADDIQVAFWTGLPKWVEVLFRIRNSLVKLVGLKGGGRDNKAMEACIRDGVSHDLASIAAKNETETVLRLDDSHLSALISIHIEVLENDVKRVSASTLVHFHKKLGYIYFYAIMPFHGIVVRQMLKRAVELVRVI